jgi:HSP20 family molecular chaperone IbpA
MFQLPSVIPATANALLHNGILDLKFEKIKSVPVEVPIADK